MRDAMRKPAISFESMNDAVAYSAPRLKMPMERWKQNSYYLKTRSYIKTLNSFLSSKTYA